MDLINSFDLSEWSQTLGWTLFHSIWQTATIGTIVWLLFHFFSKDNARLRYSIAGLGLILVFISSAITFLQYLPQDASLDIRTIQPFNEKILTNPDSSHFLAKIWNLIKIKLENSFPILVNIWMIGMVLLSLKMFINYLKTIRLKKHLVFPLSDNTKRIVDRMVMRFQLKQKVLFKESGLIEIPSVIGYFKPIVLLPVSMLSGIPENQLEIIIAHELAHIRRHDYLFQFIQEIIELLFFYHPVVWWLSSVINAEREHICDDLAVKVCGESLTLIKALNNMEAIRKKQYEMVLSLSGKKGSILNRVHRILRPKSTTNPKFERLLLSGFFGLLFIGLIFGSKLAVSGNSFLENQFSSKLNIVNHNRLENNFNNQNEAFPFGMIEKESDQKKKKEKLKKEKNQKPESSEVSEEMEIPMEPSLPEEPILPEEPALPEQPRFPEIQYSSEINDHQFNYPKDSVKSEKWVKKEVDKLILEQVEALKSASKEMENEIRDFDLTEIKNELQKELKNLDANNLKFKTDWEKEQAEMEKQLEELSSDEFMSNIKKDQEFEKEQLTKHLKEIEESKELNDKEKQRIQEHLKEAFEKINSDEFRKNIEIQIEESRETLKKHIEEMKSGEFEKRIQAQKELIQKQIEKFESAEFQKDFQQRINESKKQIQNHLDKINSPSYRKELEEKIRESNDTLGNYHPKVKIQFKDRSEKNQPIFIVDGKKTSAENIEKINPEDIDYINVLKDDQAINRYGEEGKNGVIIISLKK